MEATHLLDIKKLISDTPANLLLPLTKKHLPLFRRSPENYTLLLAVASVIILLIQWINNLSRYTLIFAIFTILVLFIHKNRIKDVYYISTEGLIVPYTWISQKIIRLDQIIEISFEKLIEKEKGSEIDGLRIIIDNPGLKFNTTGLHLPSIILTTEIYDKVDLDNFATEIHKFKRNSELEPNTLAQRLTDQINNTWVGRWKLLIFNSTDSATEFAFHIFLINTILSAFLGDTFQLFFVVLFAIYFLAVLVLNIIDRPSAIIGIRSHEFGALIYNEADLVTTVRFILMSQPYEVELLDCQLLFEGTPVAQINELRELHPKIIKSGELSYCVAQLMGNQTKSIGANIKFKYVNEETEFLLPIYWG